MCLLEIISVKEKFCNSFSCKIGAFGTPIGLKSKEAIVKISFNIREAPAKEALTSPCRQIIKSNHPAAAAFQAYQFNFVQRFDLNLVGIYWLIL